LFAKILQLLKYKKGKTSKKTHILQKEEGEVRREERKT